MSPIAACSSRPAAAPSPLQAAVLFALPRFLTASKGLYSAAVYLLFLCTVRGPPHRRPRLLVL